MATWLVLALMGCGEDEAQDCLSGTTTAYVDADGDGFGDAIESRTICGAVVAAGAMRESSVDPYGEHKWPAHGTHCVDTQED